MAVNHTELPFDEIIVNDLRNALKALADTAAVLNNIQHSGGAVSPA